MEHDAVDEAAHAGADTQRFLPKSSFHTSLRACLPTEQFGHAATGVASENVAPILSTARAERRIATLRGVRAVDASRENLASGRRSRLSKGWAQLPGREALAVPRRGTCCAPETSGRFGRTSYCFRRGGPTRPRREELYDRQDAGIARVAYLIGDKGEAALVEPRRDGAEYPMFARESEVAIKCVLETHRQEDVVSGTRAIVESLGTRIARLDDALFGHSDLRLTDGE